MNLKECATDLALNVLILVVIVSLPTVIGWGLSIRDTWRDLRETPDLA